MEALNFTPGLSHMVSGPICLRRKIYPRGHRRTRPAAIPRSSRVIGKRTHRERRRNGLSIRRGEQSGNHCGNEDSGPSAKRERILYKVGHGYILGLPVAAYLTWQGRML